jgi:hypothetical protein
MQSAVASCYGKHLRWRTTGQELAEVPCEALAGWPRSSWTGQPASVRTRVARHVREYIRQCTPNRLHEEVSHNGIDEALADNGLGCCVRVLVSP